jgi:hypothetical protein
MKETNILIEMANLMFLQLKKYGKNLKAFTLSYLEKEISVFLNEENPDIELVANTENKKVHLTE